jgi:hypothetical protein
MSPKTHFSASSCLNFLICDVENHYFYAFNDEKPLDCIARERTRCSVLIKISTKHLLHLIMNSEKKLLFGKHARNDLEILLHLETFKPPLGDSEKYLFARKCVL